MPKPRKPRASKVEVYWQKKQPKAELPKIAMVVTRPAKSKHPVVKLIKLAEKKTKLDADAKHALLAGFQAGHCTEKDFNQTKLIARIRLPDGKVKRTYACDVCGFVGHKVSQT